MDTNMETNNEKPKRISIEDMDVLDKLCQKYDDAADALSLGTRKVMDYFFAIQHPVSETPPEPRNVSVCVHHGHAHAQSDSNRKYLEEYNANELRIHRNRLASYKENIAAISDPSDRLILEPMATKYENRDTVVNYLFHLEDMAQRLHLDALDQIRKDEAKAAIPPEADTVYDMLRSYGLLADIKHPTTKNVKQVKAEHNRHLGWDKESPFYKKHRLLDPNTGRITSPYCNQIRYLLAWSDTKEVLVTMEKDEGYGKHPIHLYWNFVEKEAPATTKGKRTKKK